MARARLQYTTSTLSLAHSQVLSTSSKPFWMIAGRIGDSVKGSGARLRIGAWWAFMRP
jgi:hypothetical protein